MAFIVDASIILAWLLPDESSEYSEALLERWMNGEAISAPELIRYEVSNAIFTACKRRGRINDEQMFTKLGEFDAIGITLDERSGRCTTKETVELAIKFDLSIYDASYLELACRTEIPLATMDKKLRKAATKEKLFAAAKAD